MCASVAHYLRNGSKDFSETWHEVGGKKCQKRRTAVFFRFLPVFRKPLIYAKKAIFGHFWQFLARNCITKFSVEKFDSHVNSLFLPTHWMAEIFFRPEREIAEI